MEIYGGFWHMTKASCVSCGGELKFNRNLGFFECKFCGKIHTMNGKDVPLSLAKVDEHMLAHRFDAAEKALAELRALEPDNPLFFLRTILCKFKMTKASTMLSCTKSDNLIRTIMDCPDWEELRSYLPAEDQHFVNDVKQYCRNSLELIELDKRIDLNKGFLATTDTKEKKEKQPEDENGLFSKLKNKLPKTHGADIRSKEEDAARELEADTKRKEELEEIQKDLLGSIKELELTM